MSPADCLPPGPRGSFLGGNLREFRRDMLGFLERCARDYGDVVAIRLGRRFILLLGHPDFVEEILVAQARNFKKDFWRSGGRSLMGNGLVSSWGDIWLQQRRLCQPVFHRDRLADYAACIMDHLQEQLATWKEGQTRDLAVEMKRLTLGCISRSLFGADLGTDYNRVEMSLDTALELFVAGVGRVFRLPLRVPTPRNLRFRRTLKQMDEVIYQYIARVSRTEKGKNMLAQLCSARDEQGRQMSEREVRNQVMTLLVAGYETTASALTWTWYLLARHPQVEERLATEVRQVLGDRPPRWEDLAHLIYAERVLCESLRLYPPAYLLGREALRDCSLGGLSVPAGQTLWFSPWVMHRDPRFFERPTEFQPDRWAENLAQRLPRFAYYPFGGGPRLCIGSGLAQTEILLVLALLTQRFRFTRMTGEPIRPAPSFTLRTGPGTNVVLVRRPET